VVVRVTALPKEAAKGVNAAPVYPAFAVAANDVQAHVLIMSFSYTEDLDVLALCMTRQRCDLPLIGVPGIVGKEPEVIAVAAAARLFIGRKHWEKGKSQKHHCMFIAQSF
jgi:hypothetical protein